MSIALVKKTFWYWNRLSCMTQPELLHRLHSSLFTHLQKSGFFLNSTVPEADIYPPVNHWIFSKPSILADDYCKSADSIIEGYLNVFECPQIKYGHPPQWNKNPTTRHVAPLDFGKTINYRDERVVGDIKYLWEPSRHLQLVTLAQAYHISNDDKYLTALKVQLSSWFEQCPHMQGIHWTSSLELGIRLINWSVVWQLIGGINSPIFEGSDGQQFLKSWLDSIYQHIHFINGHYSYYSSANNHLIGEASGVFIATATWPFWKNNEPLGEHAKLILEQEVLVQIAADGVDKEQTTSYQQFVLHFLILCGLAGKANNNDFSKGYWKTIENMLDFIASVMDCSGNIPMIGDADDGYVVKLSQEQNWNPYRSLMALGAKLFDRKDFADKAGRGDEQCEWLLGHRHYFKLKEHIEKSRKPTVSFPLGGYYIMGHKFNEINETRIVIDAGDLGYQGIAAHGHADALSFTLNYCGCEFLVDPGTYAYHTKKIWRDYFRGTSAHNTIRIDGVDQSVSGGNFMWTQKAEAKCKTWSSIKNKDSFTGEHNGYARLSDPVMHRRSIIFKKDLHYIEVTDILVCKGLHKVEGFWHISEDCKVEKVGLDFRVSKLKHTLIISPPSDDVSISLHKGEELPPLGWISRQYGKKDPTNTIKWVREINGTSSFTTRMYFE